MCRVRCLDEQELLDLHLGCIDCRHAHEINSVQGYRCFAKAFRSSSKAYQLCVESVSTPIRMPALNIFLVCKTACYRVCVKIRGWHRQLR